MQSLHLVKYIENKVNSILEEEFPEISFCFEIEEVVYSFFKDPEAFCYTVHSNCIIDEKELLITIGPVIGLPQNFWDFTKAEATNYAIVVANYIAKSLIASEDFLDTEDEDYEDLDSSELKYLA